MTNRKDGGDAFPCAGNPDCEQFMPGMSLRDWFAGMALQGLVTSAMHNKEIDISSTLYARSAYTLADEMLKARGE